MLYLTVQMLALLLLAIGIGVAIGWLLRGARDSATHEAVAQANAARLADLRRDRDAAEAALADATAAQHTADEAKLAEMQSALDQCRASVSTLESERDDAKAALAAAQTQTAEAKETSLAAAPSPAAAVSQPTAAASASDSTQPDDLKQISGIGPKLEGLLLEAGITRFEQIANLTAAQILDLDDILNFKGRIERDDWVGQAKRLAAGEKP